MSICPKNKSSKARRDKRRANWKMSAPNLVKCSKCGELNDASQSMQGLRLLQQKRNHCSGLILRMKLRIKSGVCRSLFCFDTIFLYHYKMIDF